MYSTDLTDAKWDNIKKSLDKDFRKRKNSLRSVSKELLRGLRTTEDYAATINY